MSEDRRPLTIFVHVPKTGGATFRAILLAQFSPRTALNLGKSEFATEAAVPLVQQRLNTLEVVFGHIKYGLHEHLERPCRYLLFLRSPQDRLISLYLFLLGLARPESADDSEAKLVDGFHRYVESGVVDGRVPPEFEREFDNGQTRRLAAVASEERCDEATLDLALSRMEDSGSLVCLTERFDESLVLVQRRWGWRYLHYRRTNVTRAFRHGGALREVAGELVEKHARFDAALYEAAVRRFEADVSAEGPAFAVAVEEFSARNSEFSQLVKGRSRSNHNTVDPVLHANLELWWRGEELRANEGVIKRLTARVDDRERELERMRSKLAKARAPSRGAEPKPGKRERP